MRISTEIRNRRMMGFLLKGKPPKEVARKFNLSVWAVYKAQKRIQSPKPPGEVKGRRSKDSSFFDFAKPVRPWTGHGLQDDKPEEFSSVLPRRVGGNTGRPALSGDEPPPKARRVSGIS